MNQETARKDWNERGFSFGIFRDPPGQVWADFVHRTNELVMLAEGEIELEIEGKTQRPLIGKRGFYPGKYDPYCEECREHQQRLVLRLSFPEMMKTL